ncbi:B12-binding domain-containing radical SAM protein [Candidatus Woesearchaeota archaeon]|jgi:radical SAM superfamily enzyme YgiQ (UPF0313 family)|nr:B12-binding domain-containing radical SAM protein [Candidatus Woesearchaeota archaeon]
MKDKKIDYLFVYPKPTTDSPNKQVPLSIIYPGNYFMSKGFNVEFHDCRFENESDLFKKAKNSKIFAVSAMTGFQCGEAARLMKLAKKINPKIKTLLGGYHATLRKDEVLKERFVDDVVVGRLGEDLFPFNEKTRYLFEQTDFQWSTSTGCWGKCTFCCLEKKWNPKPLDVLEKELIKLHKELRFKHITFIDPNIGANYKRVEEIGKILKKLGDITFHANIRNDALTEKMVNALEGANCISLEVGCESGDDHMLKNIINKGHDKKIILRTARFLSKTNITAMYSFIAHMPYETKKSLNKTLDLIDKIQKIDSNARTSIYTYTPFPNTEMFDMAVKAGFKPPTTMVGWSKIGMSSNPLYWIVGLQFRKDNTRRNFPGITRLKILPFEILAAGLWKFRVINWFPSELVSKIIKRAVHYKKSK